ncbi:MAG: hypothetical protein KC468_33030, partial [Myxococcales bacterium]|nr:hypothetical protein [Myxococcales bacterium]
EDALIVVDEPAVGLGLVGYPAVFWGPRWRSHVVEHDGVTIEIWHTLWRPRRQAPNEAKAQLYRDIPGHLEAVARRTIDIARSGGAQFRPGARLVVVQGPLRASIASFTPTATLISDQMLQLVPGPRFMNFHRIAAARGMFDALLHQHFAGRHDPSTDLWLPGACAMAMVDVWALRERYGDEYARDILGKFAFVPTVDNFLYTGQASFADAYFRGSEDSMPLRNHALWFANDLPTGRRIHEKLRDLNSPEQLLEIYRELLAKPDAPPKSTIERVYGHRLGWFFDQWLGPYPSADYSVASVEERRRPEGGWRVEVAIRRESEQPVIEPVQLLVTEKGGERHHLLWNGDDEAATTLADVPTDIVHRFTLTTARRVKRVEIDPRFRLVERPLEPDNVDPLLNNRTPAALRFLYTGFGLNIAISEFLNARTVAARLSALSFYVFFEASRQRDVRHTGHFQLYSDRNTSIGAAGGVQFWFGPLVNRLRRRTRLRLFTDLGQLTDRGLDTRGGFRFGQTLALVDDTRGFSRWPDRGRRLALALYGSQVFRTAPGQQDHRYSVSAAAYWVQLWPLAHQHVIATQLSAAAMLPIASEPEYRSLLRVGGIGDLDGYSGSELHSRAYVMANAEYRHVFFNNMELNIGHVAWWRSFGGVLGAGAATISSCDDYDGLFEKESWYADASYGLFAQTFLLGVSPQLVKLSVSVPFVRRHMHCLGNVFPKYLAERQGQERAADVLSPVNINLTFVQSF